MKLQTILPLLVIAGFLPLILAEPCRFYTDLNGKCVIRCKYPQIGYSDTKMCLSDESKCTQFYVLTYDVCSSQCPQGFAVKPAQGKKYQYCIPCQFQGENGKCYENCPSTMITDQTTKKCLSSPTQCQAYYLADSFTCQSSCPPNYIADNNSSPKRCVYCYSTGNCNGDNQKPKDNKNDESSTNKNLSCTQYLAANMHECLSQCPPQQIALPQVQGQSYIQCQICPSSLPFVSKDGSICVSQCNTREVLLQQNCIQISHCKLNVHTDDNKNLSCIKQCPPSYKSVQVQDQPYSICQPSGGKLRNLYSQSGQQ
ncbi:hypothetical protein ABPG74_010208 [Tetrahymena malaccensis]